MNPSLLYPIVLNVRRRHPSCRRCILERLEGIRRGFACSQSCQISENLKVSDSEEAELEFRMSRLDLDDELESHKSGVRIGRRQQPRLPKANTRSCSMYLQMISPSNLARKPKATWSILFSASFNRKLSASQAIKKISTRLSKDRTSDTGSSSHLAPRDRHCASQLRSERVKLERRRHHRVLHQRDHLARNVYPAHPRPAQLCAHAAVPTPTTHPAFPSWGAEGDGGSRV